MSHLGGITRCLGHRGGRRCLLALPGKASQLQQILKGLWQVDGNGGWGGFMDRAATCKRHRGLRVWYVHQGKCQ